MDRKSKILLWVAIVATTLSTIVNIVAAIASLNSK